ncbi:MAG TPA: helix-turn-helix domain-containing protein [Chloroflexota bacterium]|nr:helix-turn-helix domain-containing protein [Chloroflexota bacterium]
MGPTTVPNLEALGHFIRSRRQSLNLTQTQLADRLGWVQERISALEHGKYGMPSLPALARVAEALDAPLASIIEVAGYPSSVPVDGRREAGAVSSAALLYTLQRLLAIEATNLRGALNEASDLMAYAMGADKVDAFIFEPSSTSLVALGTSDTPMGRLQHQTGLDRLPLANRGRTVEVYESGTPYSTGQADHDPGVTVGVVETLGVRSLCAVPLRVDGTINGVLAAESRQPDRFSPDEQEFFVATAHWVGMVAHRAQLVEAMTHRAEEASDVA